MLLGKKVKVLFPLLARTRSKVMFLRVNGKGRESSTGRKDKNVGS